MTEHCITVKNNTGLHESFGKISKICSLSKKGNSKPRGKKFYSTCKRKFTHDDILIIACCYLWGWGYRALTLSPNISVLFEVGGGHFFFFFYNDQV